MPHTNIPRQHISANILFFKKYKIATSLSPTTILVIYVAQSSYGDCILICSILPSLSCGISANTITLPGVLPITRLSSIPKEQISSSSTNICSLLSADKKHKVSPHILSETVFLATIISSAFDFPQYGIDDISVVVPSSVVIRQPSLHSTTSSVANVTS